MGVNSIIDDSRYDCDFSLEEQAEASKRHFEYLEREHSGMSRLIDADKIKAEDFYDCVDMYECMEVINQQPTSDGWIPCSRELPKEYKPVLVTTDKGKVEYGKKYATHWHTTDTIYSIDRVIAWMPLPQPYKEGEE